MALTMKVPGVEFAVNLEDVATPLLFVRSVSVVVPSAKVPLAPEEGAVNVTFSPGVPIVFVVTVAARGATKVRPPAALCDDPLCAASARTSGVGGVVDGLDELLLLLQPVRRSRGRKRNARRPAGALP